MKDPATVSGGSCAGADPYKGKPPGGAKKSGSDWAAYLKSDSREDADTAKKLARIAAIKKAALNNKKSNVGTSTAADADASPALSSLLTGGGGYGSGYLADSGGNGGFSFSDIPSIVWVILAVGAGYWLMKSGGKGKLF
jgi:hypothetical protein